MLTLDQLRAAVDEGSIDTVLVAFTDMQGRLQGKRCAAPYFLADVVPHAAEACNYLLAVDVEMNTVGGYAMSSWERGYGDFVLKPDLATLRLVPWQEGTALVLCDAQWADGSPVVASPRQILRGQLDRLAEHGLHADVGTELEFMIFADSFDTAWRKGYHQLEPANLYNVDYSMLGTARVEPLLRRIRNGMAGAGMVVESAKGECNLGQHEIAFRYADALTTCDNHTIYKTGAKEIADQAGTALTFMAKYDEREGNSCHIHISLRGEDGPVFAGESEHGFSPLFEHFVAGQQACLRELTYLFAPNVNSYKRYAEGSFAPTAVAWGLDNRTCALRVVGHGPSLRVENRVPGGDMNPYLGVAALIAAGLHGIENELPLEPELAGNAYTSDAPRVPSTLREAAELFAGSTVAVDAFGQEVVEHYANAARVELAAFDSAVTDWERRRGFERL
ncbi:glutamine synthetase family protein [Pseudonocardia xinjiangensis]|uniref:Glutamine synthetase n=1 Tax=Pseudonocardia xinjiangensis TaxID=75289 RepID=A0ABX1R8K8_9PSEU|nr:glutamine synthetase family protein [Pseudonocardia xinjiangensis]NMH76710.1 glutamine synthetase [Pseudonocardia xinjiangensis]